MWVIKIGKIDLVVSGFINDCTFAVGVDDCDVGCWYCLVLPDCDGKVADVWSCVKGISSWEYAFKACEVRDFGESHDVILFYGDCVTECEEYEFAGCVDALVDAWADCCTFGLELTVGNGNSGEVLVIGEVVVLDETVDFCVRDDFVGVVT